MIIAGLQKSTLIDFPGKIACIVFLAGCNFRCPWCYSSELVLPLKIVTQPRFSEKEVLDFLRTRKGLLDGVVICGGEPTINKDLGLFLEKIKELGFAIKLDTNGSNPKILKDLTDRRLIDYVAMDIKAPRALKSEARNPKSEIYEKIMEDGVKMEDIEESVEFLKNGRLDFEFRTTCVPGVHKKEEFLDIAKWIGGKNVKYYLQSFVSQKTIDPAFLGVKPFKDKFLQDVSKEISPYFLSCQLR